MPRGGGPGGPGGNHPGGGPGGPGGNRPGGGPGGPGGNRPGGGPGGPGDRSHLGYHSPEHHGPSNGGMTHAAPGGPHGPEMHHGPEPHHPPRREHRHPIPFGLMLSERVYERVHYERIRNTLYDLVNGRPVPPAGMEMLEQAFGRRIDPREAMDLLHWIDEEMRYF